MKILLADDDPEILQIYSDMLLGNGYDVTVAKNGKEVIHFLDGRVFDMLILDLLMPEMDGFEAILTLRKKGYDVPVIVMTGYYENDVIKRRLKGVRVSAILRKPVMISVLLNAVKEASA